MGNRINSPAVLWAVTAVVALATAGCASRGGSSGSQPAAAPAPAAAAPAPAARGGAKPGMDAQGNVVDSSKVEAGSGPESLKYVSMIGNDMALDTGVGVCGKEGQSVPVGVGQPTLRIDNLTVGGTA